MNLAQKLKLIDPAIAWMIEKNIKHHNITELVELNMKIVKNIGYAFDWDVALHISDEFFWAGIWEELDLIK